MITSVAHVSIPVTDYDEAIRFYTGTLGLELRADNPMGPDRRWITVGAKGQHDVDLVMHIPEDGQPAERSFGHGVVFFTDDCRKDVENLKRQDVKVTLEADDQPWGVQAVFEDPFGNSQVLVEPSELGLEQRPLEE